MADRRSADAALGAEDGDGPAERRRGRPTEQFGERADHSIVATGAMMYSLTPALYQLAIEQDVVDVADDHDLRAGVAELRRLSRPATSSFRPWAFSMMMTFGVGALR